MVFIIRLEGPVWSPWCVGGCAPCEAALCLVPCPRLSSLPRFLPSFWGPLVFSWAQSTLSCSFSVRLQPVPQEGRWHIRTDSPSHSAKHGPAGCWCCGPRQACPSLAPSLQRVTNTVPPEAGGPLGREQSEVREQETVADGLWPAPPLARWLLWRGVVKKAQSAGAESLGFWVSSVRSGIFNQVSYMGGSSVLIAGP